MHIGMTYSEHNRWKLPFWSSLRGIVILPIRCQTRVPLIVPSVIPLWLSAAQFSAAMHKSCIRVLFKYRCMFNRESKVGRANGISRQEIMLPPLSPVLHSDHAIRACHAVTCVQKPLNLQGARMIQVICWQERTWWIGALSTWRKAEATCPSNLGYRTIRHLGSVNLRDNLRW